MTGVSSVYIALRALDRQLEISHATARNYGETKRIFGLRFKEGIVGQVEVAQIESQYQEALAAIPVFERQIAVQENLLSILLGRNPAPIRRGKAIDQLASPGIPSGLPSVCSIAGRTSLPLSRISLRRTLRSVSPACFLFSDHLPHRFGGNGQRIAFEHVHGPGERVAVGRRRDGAGVYFWQYRGPGTGGRGGATAGA